MRYSIVVIEDAYLSIEVYSTAKGQFSLDCLNVSNYFKTFKIQNFSSKRAALPEIGDIEQRFIEKETQELLYKLTGLDLHGKIYRERNVSKQERPHYALMTDAMFQDVNYSI